MLHTLNQSLARSLPAVLLGLGLAGPVLAAAPLQERSASLQCADRKVTVEAACFPYAGSIMACTRQAIRFFGADGKALGARVFESKPLKGADYPVVPEQFGELSCVETKDKDKLVVASMTNGGNCEQCEWHDVYSPDGTLLGSTRDRKKAVAAVDAAVGALYDRKARHVLGKQPLTDLYQDGAAR